MYTYIHTCIHTYIHTLVRTCLKLRYSMGFTRSRLTYAMEIAGEMAIYIGITWVVYAVLKNGATFLITNDMLPVTFCRTLEGESRSTSEREEHL